MEKYTITQDQFLSLKHYNRMFELYSGIIEDISSKGHDELSLGFELGKLHGDIRDSFLSMAELLNNIKNGEESPKISFDQPNLFESYKNDDLVPYHTICGCNPANGGSGICGCVMGNKLVTKSYGTHTNFTTSGSNFDGELK